MTSVINQRTILIMGIITVIASVTIFPYYYTNDVFADSDVIMQSPTVQLDREVYPVPFGDVNDFAEDILKSYPNGRSLFPVHMTAINGNSIDASTTLGSGDLTVHIRINDKHLDVSSLETDVISRDTVDEVGPLKISVIRDDKKVVLAYAGGSTPNENGLIDIDDNNSENARQLGPIYEIAPDSGIFELDFVIRYTDGPSNSKCPTTTMFTSLNNDAAYGSEESRFDLPSAEKENYCVMKGDVLIVEYTSIDASGNVNVVTNSATFDLRDGVLKSDKSTYRMGWDIILTLTDPDLDLDNDVAETYSLDLIEWNSSAATLTMGELGGEATSFDPEPLHFRETGDNTGIFQLVVEIPHALQDIYLERGEEIVLEYTDWSPSGADYVGQENEDINFTIYTSDSRAAIHLDKKLYNWTDKVYITIYTPDHNFDSNLIDEIGEIDHNPITITTSHFTLDNYKLVEDGRDTGTFTGEITLTSSTYNPDSTPTGKGPTDGLIPSSDDDSITISFEFSEDETIVGSAIIKWNKGQMKPFQQQMLGISPTDVVCKSGLLQVYGYDGSAACVTSDTQSKLMKRGWTR